MSKSNNSSGNIDVNAAAVAEAVRETEMPYEDDLVTGEDGPFREETRAVNLANGAGQGTYQKIVTEEARKPQAEHEGLEGRLLASEPRRNIDEQLHGAAASLVSVFRAIPFSSMDHGRKVLSNVAKVLLLAGDTAVLANQTYRASTPLWLAIPLGLSLATSVVAIGAKCGHEIATSSQRRDRGEAPKNIPWTALPYYDDGKGDERFKLWLQFAMAAAGAMFLSLFFIGVGAGDSSRAALGYGFLGALTVVGSIGAEAYATNDAAEERQSAEATRTAEAATLKDYEKLEQTSASAASYAKITEQSARHAAVAVTAAVGAIANRLADTPKVGGYIDGGHIPVTEAPPAPAKENVLGSVSMRDRKRAATNLGDAQMGVSSSSAPMSPSGSSTSQTTSRKPTTWVEVLGVSKNERANANGNGENA